MASRTIWLLGAMAIVMATLHETNAVEATQRRDVLLEIYYTSGDARGEQYLAQTKEFSGSRPGILVVARDLNSNPTNVDRLKKIAAHFQLKEEPGPVIYGCNRVICNATEDKVIQSALRDALRFEVFVRQGCSRCTVAEEVLPAFLHHYPALELTFRSVNTDPKAINDMNALVRKYKASAASTPVLHFCGALQIGFDRSTATTDRLRKALERWTVEAGKVAPRENKVSEVTVQDPF